MEKYHVQCAIEEWKFSCWERWDFNLRYTLCRVQVRSLERGEMLG